MSASVAGSDKPVDRSAGMMRVGAVALVSTACIVASACESGAVPGDRAGNPAAPTVVTILTEEIHATPTLLLRLLSQRVSELSDGAVILDVRTRAVDGGVAWDQATIELADTGAAEGVLVRAGSWHSLGVTTLDVLQLPTVVETDDQADRVAADDDLVADLLAGLSLAGYTGLGVYPEGPRHLMLLDDSTSFSLDVLAGRTVRTPLSDTVFEVLAATGMQPVDVSPQDFVAAVASGHVTVTEGHLERVALTVTDDGRNDSVVATNLTLYTKFVVLAVRSGSVEHAVMSVLQEAARSVLPDFLAQRSRELDDFPIACDAGGVLIEIPERDRQALVTAMAPVVEAVASGPDASLFARVDATAGTPRRPSLTCAGRRTAATSSTVASTGAPTTDVATDGPGSPPVTLPDRRDAIVPTPGELPNGVYRFTHTIAALESIDPDGDWTAADEMIGEFVLADGTSEIRYYDLGGSPMPGEPPDTGGTYQVIGDLVIFATPPERSLPGTDGIHLLRWSFDDGTLTFEQVDGKPRDADFGVPWIRVADAS